MPGHGTILTSSEGQDESSMAVDGTGGSSLYKKGIQDAYNASGGTVNAGDVVIVEWDEDNERLQISSMGTRATGEVDSSGETISITNSGDTSLEGDISVSSEYGENEGWARSTASCGNVNGEASYLSE